MSQICNLVFKVGACAGDALSWQCPQTRSWEAVLINLKINYINQIKDKSNKKWYPP